MKCRSIIHHHVNLIIILTFIISAAFIYNPIVAQDEPNKIPELNGHVFLPNIYMEDPFNNTYLDIAMGIGTTGQYKYPVFEIDENEFIYALKGELLYANIGIQYQQKIQDWISLQIKYYLSARIGTNIGSILAQGFTTMNSFQIGWKIRIIEREKYMLSGNFGVSNYTGTYMSISQFVDDVINEEPNPSIVSNVPALNGNFGFQFAYGVSSLFGLKLNYTNSLGESLDRESIAYLFSFGASGDFNF